MFENVGRKITLILSLLAVAVIALIVGKLRLGLDLQGGTRMEYRIPYEDALAEGTISQQEYNDKAALTRQMTQIILERVDPTGVREPKVIPVGEDRIVIELPGSDTEAQELIVAHLEAELAMNVKTLTLAENSEVIAKFPSSGGTLLIGAEKIYFMKRDGHVLRSLKRGYADTPESAHEAGAEVRLINADPWRTVIENVGNLSFFIKAKPEDLQGQATDLTTEKTRVTNWIKANPGASTEAYNRLPFESGGPAPRLKWYPHANTDDGRPLEERIEALIQDKNEDLRFSGDALKSVSLSHDDYGYPAVGFEIVNTRKSDFGDFTGKHVREPMAIVINGEIVTMPTINQMLPGGGIINGGQGGFKLDEVQDLITVLRSGSLKIKPVLEHQERVGATLGRDYVRRGAFSVLLGLLTVLLFVMWYYKRLGVFAAISLLANLLLLMGVMAFLQATLTLPGVAGIILTVGMAVDANILIYERIREEALRGRKPAQAAQDGFKHALSTIVDANLTTLITGLILYHFGSGPVAGFATTLCWGIVTSMFAALVITKVLVHLQLEKGIDSWKMVRWISATKIDFMGHSKQAAVGSLVAIVLGVTLFLGMPTRDKLGIDFLGGVTMTVRTQEPQNVDLIRERVSQIPGTIGKSSEVKEILASSNEGGYNQFRITFKTPSKAEMGDDLDDQGQEALKDTVGSEIQGQLGDLLEKGPYEVRLPQPGSASGVLYFNEVHPEEAIVKTLEGLGLSEIKIERVSGPTAAWSFSATTTLDKSELSLTNEIATAFTDKDDGFGSTFEWAIPIPSSAVVGAQVVAELRDNAIFAILLSLFAAVMYIRVRFAEYSYGLAAVVALVHDVLITLGALALVQELDLIEAEINLPMIAAFLTIIGYSLNDTIVVFDRVRENLPRMKGTMREIINTSINQTLSRTLLTSMTTLLTVMILLAFNFGSRNVLEGFAFALTMGVLVGTYSSVYIACPMLLRFESRRLHLESEEQAKEQTPATVAS